MLRIVTEQHGSQYTLSLHGRLVGPWVAELERYWQSIVTKVPGAKIVVAFSDVAFIDAAGEKLLERMWREGTEFVTSGCLIRYLVDKVCGKSGRPRLPH